MSAEQELARFDEQVQFFLDRGETQAFSEGAAGTVAGESRQQILDRMPQAPPPNPFVPEGTTGTGGGTLGIGEDGEIAFTPMPSLEEKLPSLEELQNPAPGGIISGSAGPSTQGPPGFVPPPDIAPPGGESTPTSLVFQRPSIDPNVGTTLDRKLTTEDPRLTSIIDRFMKGGITDEESRIQEGRFIDEQREGSSALRQDLADRFASQGVSGGKAQGALGQVFGQTQRGIAQGVSNIRLNTLNKQLESRGRALAALLQQSGMSSQEATSIAALETQRAISEGQLQLGNNQLQLDEGFRRDQLASQEEISFAGLELERLLGLENIDVAREENETGLIMFLLELANDANEAQRKAIFDYLELLGFDIGPNVSIS